MAGETGRGERERSADTVGQGPGAWALVLVALAGAVARVFYDLVVMRSERQGLDAVAYTLMAQALRDGDGYVLASSLFQAEPRPTAAFAPGYAAYQAVWGGFAGWDVTANRLAGVLPGMVTILLAGLLARRLLGRRAGLLAAGIVALDPTLIAVDGSAMAENVSVPLVTAALWLTVRMVDQGPEWRSALGLGVVCGAAMLTRPDLVLLLPLLAVAVALMGGAAGRTRRMLLMGVAVTVAVVMVLPWSLRNQRVLGTYAIATISPSSAIAGSNCDITYGGRGLGAYDNACVDARRLEGADEAGQVAHYREEAAEYGRRHLGRAPLVLAARELRVWGFWDPRDQIGREVVESRSLPWQRLAWPVRLATVVTGAVGLVLLMREHRRRGVVLLAPIVIATVSAALSYGNPRFASIAQPVLAIGVVAVVVRCWQRWRRGAGPGSEVAPVGSTA